jgi:hypothetical protein
VPGGASAGNDDGFAHKMTPWRFILAYYTKQSGFLI